MKRLPRLLSLWTCQTTRAQTNRRELEARGREEACIINLLREMAEKGLAVGELGPRCYCVTEEARGPLRRREAVLYEVPCKDDEGKKNGPCKPDRETRQEDERGREVAVVELSETKPAA